MRALAAMLLLALAIPTASFAVDRGQYANVDPAIRHWYETRELTEAAQRRFHFTSCCAKADVVKTRFKVSGAGHDEWWFEKDGAFQRIPDDIIHWNEHAPSGEPVLFAVGGQPVCFFPPDAGI